MFSAVYVKNSNLVMPVISDVSVHCEVSFLFLFVSCSEERQLTCPADKVVFTLDEVSTIN